MRKGDHRDPDASAPSLPPELACTWPMIEARERFGLGYLRDARDPAIPAARGNRGVGLCDLATQALKWSATTHDLFGLPLTDSPILSEAIRQYAEPSRAIMERLRAHAPASPGLHARRRNPFPDRGTRWIRLVAAPVCLEGRIVRLRGVKRDVTELYR